MFCKNCGTPIKEGAQFCKGCGAKVAVTAAPNAAVESVNAAHCKQCGNELKSDSKFCKNCGATVGGGSAVDVTPVVPPQTENDSTRREPPPNREYCYLGENDEQKGPLSIDGLKSAELTPDTWVWTEGFADWKPAKEVDELKILFKAPPTGRDAARHVSTSQPSSSAVKYMLIAAGAALIVLAVVFGINMFNKSEGPAEEGDTAHIIEQSQPQPQHAQQQAVRDTDYEIIELNPSKIDEFKRKGKGEECDDNPYGYVSDLNGTFFHFEARVTEADSQWDGLYYNGFYPTFFRLKH